MKVGETFLASGSVKFGELLPSSEAVTNATCSLAKQQRTELSDLVIYIDAVGGGVTTDGMTNHFTVDHYYDLIVHYFCIRRQAILTCRG